MRYPIFPDKTSLESNIYYLNICYLETERIKAYLGERNQKITMKIVHVTARYFPRMGGVESFTKELCEKLSEKGFETVVYSLDLDNDVYSRESINGVLVKRYHAVLGDPFFLPSPLFLRDLRKEDPSNSSCT